MWDKRGQYFICQCHLLTVVFISCLGSCHSSHTFLAISHLPIFSSQLHVAPEHSYGQALARQHRCQMLDSYYDMNKYHLQLSALCTQRHTLDNKYDSFASFQQNQNQQWNKHILLLFYSNLQIHVYRRRKGQTQHYDCDWD